MIAAESSESLVRFPQVHAGSAPEVQRWLRPFGLYEADLHVDLRATARPVAITQVLRNCLCGDADADADEEFLWNLSVGNRIHALVTLAVAWDGGAIDLTLGCPETACKEDMEIELTLGDLAELQDAAHRRQPMQVEIVGEWYPIRRPTGRDQLLWLRGSYADEREAMRAMVRMIAGDAAASDRMLDAGTIAAIGEAMAGFDPLVDCTVTVRCFNCGCEHGHAVDLEEMALRRLRRAQLRLLSTVHQLAWHYKWSEQQTFAVPHWRREHYLWLIEQEQR